MMKSTTNKDDADMMKSYAYGGRVPADGSMAKPAAAAAGEPFTPPNPYTTKEAEEARKNEALSLVMSSFRKSMIG